MWEIAKSAHIKTGHGGRDKIKNHLAHKYANLSLDDCLLYKNYCLICQEKKKLPRTKGVVVRPIVTKDFGLRCQVDLIDMQSVTHSKYKWILNFQCHFSKFNILRPLFKKCAIETTHQVIDIFTTFGAFQ